MRSNEPSVRASVLTALPAYLKSRGIHIRELLAEAKIDLEAPNEPDLTIPFAATATLFDIAARRLGDPAFGLSYAEAFPPGGTGLLGQIVMTAPTIRDALIALERFLPVHMSPMEVRLEERDGIARFYFASPSSIAVPLTHIVGFYFASLVLRLRDAAGPNWLPIAVEFEHRQPDELEHYRKIFGSRLTFDRKSNVIVIDANTLGRRMSMLDERLKGLHDAVHENLLELSKHKLIEQASVSLMSSRLQAVLASRLASESTFDLEAVAKELQLPARALQWRLEQEHTSYEKVVLATRVVEAERYLRDSNHQLTRIAALLGFSELSAFTRWSQKQFHMTPSALRQHLRSGGRALASPGNDAT